ncbi:MAG: TonB-dependent receptor [Candidatus Andeanibacterium colombiense]|uniref:TonB-dependent receptor n=1 Tax=Candidatus Andeanibacterium colombiense TaxID=3121345 RepID=A0AAJ5X065_9SPHN|nr:MAG: TonB-dependent receptor [Sphingomonadaceae bacterium]
MHASDRGRRRMKSCFLAFTALTAVAGAALGATAAQAQSGAQAQTYPFDLPAQPLSQSVLQIGSIGKVQVLYSDDGSPRLNAPALKGRMTVDQALTRILAGSGYAYEYTRPGVITLRRTASAVGNGADGEVVTGVVSVEGVAGGSPYFGGAGQAAGVNGVNGSRDITATEGTGSFTSGALTIGSKVPQALKDVPQSISVLTNERLEQQNVTDFTTAMKQLPGVTLVQGTTSLETNFYSRGFTISSIQVDGGAPLTTQFGFYPQIDMSIYDHVELLRGAAGLFNGYGDPSGTVNLVRKKPLDHAQVSVEAQASSWQNYRVVADATSPLTRDGRLRGRLVMTYQDNHYFYDTAKNNKTLVYGVAEFDATPTTLVSGGVNYVRQSSVPWRGGLPRYLNGEDINLPRSTALAFPWNRWDFDTREIFGAVEQKIGSDWTLKLNLTQNHQTSTQKLGYSNGAVNPTNGLGAQLRGSYSDYASDQLSAEATFSGAFVLFGQRQEVTFGANRVDSDGGDQISYAPLINGISSAPYQPYPGGPIYCNSTPANCPAGYIRLQYPPVDVLNFDPTDLLYTEPRNSLPATHVLENGQIQSGVYINLRLTAFDRLHLTTGLRWSRYESKSAYEYLCIVLTGACAGKAIGDVYSESSYPYRDDDISWPPPVNLSLDVTKAVNVYVGYTDIYQSQANTLGADLNPLAPITGSNWEGGVKWAARDGRLNLSVAGYRIRKKGFGTPDPSDPSSGSEETPPGSGIYCCYIADRNRTYESKGIDLEVTGELLPGWQLSASYVYNRNSYEGSNTGYPEGTPLISIAPKQLYKLWMSYDFGAAGHLGALSGLTLSGGVNGQSSGYNQGSTCVTLDPDAIPNPLTGAQSCLDDPNDDTDGFQNYRYTVPAYALLSARIDYRFSDKWSLALNLDNILDKTYYQTTGSVTSGNWYGAPRSVTASLRAKW